jgi:formamidopyrimidine-DNA glycosylase
LHPVVLGTQSAGAIARIAEGRKIQEVFRRGKYLFLELDAGLVEMHFRFDGQLVWFRSAREFLNRANIGDDGVHVDVAFELNKGVLGFVDPRHLGRVRGWESREQCTTLKKLGVDALSLEFTAAALRERLASSRRSLKEFLLDQGQFAGIGNIYSCEALWQARLDPRRLANSLKRDEPTRLHKAIVSVLRRALECCLEPAPDFHDPKWWFQGLEKIVRVYQRDGSECPRCGKAIQRIEQGGRSTYCCLNCQR